MNRTELPPLTLASLLGTNPALADGEIQANGDSAPLPFVHQIFRKIGDFFASIKSKLWGLKKLDVIGHGANLNALTRNVFATARSGAALTSGEVATVAALGTAIASLQLVHGLTLIYIGVTQLPDSWRKKNEAKDILDDAKLNLDSVARDAAAANYDAALAKYHNCLCLTGLGVLFLVLGSLVLAQVALGSTIVGGALSVACIGYGGFLMYRTIQNMREIHDFKKFLNDYIKSTPFYEIDLKKIIDTIEPSDMRGKDWARCQRILGSDATEKLKPYIESPELLSGMTQEKKVELLETIYKGASESALKQKTLFGIGFILLLGGVIGTTATALSPFTGGASSTVSVALLGIGIGAGTLGTLGSTGSIITDSSYLFRGVQKVVGKVASPIPKDIQKILDTARTEAILQNILAD